MSGVPGPSTPAPSPGTDGRSDTSVVTQFFLLPLAVVAGLLGVFLLFTLATRQPPSAREHLRTLRSGRFNQRWQAAFELSNLLRRGGAVREDRSLVKELTKIFLASAVEPDPDPRVRRYLALALGNSGSPEAVPTLLKAVRQEDAETRLYALWGLARLGAREARTDFLKGLEDPDPSVRSVSAYGLGRLSGDAELEGLRKALGDPVEEVRWNAALALGRRGDPSGTAILIALLDRGYLDQFSSMETSERSETIVNSLRALKYLNVQGLEDRIDRLARLDPDPRVRAAARSWGRPDRP